MKSFKKRTATILRHEINVTPFVDVMLVLLIIFMVAAPMMTSGLDVDLPCGGKQQTAAPVEPPMTVTLDKKGQLFLGDKCMSKEQMLASLKSLSKEQQLYLRADKELPYARIVEIMVLIIGGGHSKIALVTEEGQTAR